jgi:hypothetical protein
MLEVGCVTIKAAGFVIGDLMLPKAQCELS